MPGILSGLLANTFSNNQLIIQQMMQTPPQTQMQPNLVNQTNISMVNPNPPQGGYYPQPPPNPVTYVTQTTTMHAGSLQSSIPIMPMCLAIILCIVNCLIPGFGKYSNNL